MTTSSPESHPTPTDIPLVPIDLRPATPNLEPHSVPFPVVEMLKPQESRSPSPGEYYDTCKVFFGGAEVDALGTAFR